MADIVLINPRFETSYWGLEHALPILCAKAIMPTAGLPLLAALTPAEHRVTIIDENVEAIDFARCARADIVGVTGMSVQRQRMIEILTELKRRGVFTVVGGPWVTVREGYFGALADVVVIGEAEESWPRFLREWQEGRHAQRYEQAERTDMATVPAPRLDLLRMSRYVFGSLQFSRGCPFTCEFCDIIVVFGRRPRVKTPAQVLAELDALLAQGKRHVFIVDDNLIGNKKLIMEILRAVADWQRTRGYPMDFVTEASLDLADDPEMLQLMVAANIDAVFVGIETPSEEALRETGKLQNIRSRGGTMLEKVRRIQAAGLEVLSGMILGFDSDDERIFEAQRRFVQEARIVNAMVGMLSAIPKTPLYERLAREGRLDEGDPPEFGTNVIPVKLSRSALRDGYLGVLRDLNQPEAYFDRLDQLYLEGGLRPQSARLDYLKGHPLRRLGFNLWVLVETTVMVTLLLYHAESGLRREYLRRLVRVVKHRAEPVIIQVYAMKCAMHHHAWQMSRGMLAREQPITNSY